MFMLPLWNKYTNHSTDIWNSLAIFLEGYAFERQGKRPDYPYAAVDALLLLRNNTSTLTRNSSIMLWRQFSRLLSNQNLNCKNNPLYPSANPNNLPNFNPSNRSLIEIIATYVPQGSTLTSYIKNLIKHNRDIYPAHELLTEIRGIKDKIASFFLRDLVIVMNINLLNTRNRHLLQPVDIWVKRTIKTISNNSSISKKQIANWIVNNSLRNGVSPEKVNMGIWFFCSQIITSEYRLKKALNNFYYAQSLLRNYKASLNNICNSC